MHSTLRHNKSRQILQEQLRDGADEWDGVVVAEEVFFLPPRFLIHDMTV